MKLSYEIDFDGSETVDSKALTSRRKARIVALQALYESDAVNHLPGLALERLLKQSHLSKESSVFAGELVAEIRNNLTEIDAIIQKYAPVWPVDELAIIDRNILRLAVYEIMFDSKTPPKVAINEAVELAKIFGTENSSRFVNGVLGSVIGSVSK